MKHFYYLLIFLGLGMLFLSSWEYPGESRAVSRPFHAVSRPFHAISLPFRAVSRPSLGSGNLLNNSGIVGSPVAVRWHLPGVRARYC